MSNETKEDLFNELKKLSKTANQRIVRLEREFGKDSWAASRLRNQLDTEKLSAWTEKGRIAVNNKMSNEQMKNTIKMTKRFLDSQTSTIKGIRNVREKQIKNIQKTRSDIKDLSYKEAEDLYKMFEDKDFIDLSNKYGASEVWDFIDNAKEKNMMQDEFITTLQKYASASNNDLDFREKAERLYNKYV